MGDQGIGFPPPGGRRIVQGGAGGRAAQVPRSKSQGQHKIPAGPRNPEQSSKVSSNPPPEQIRYDSALAPSRPDLPDLSLLSDLALLYVAMYV